jgi:hypothetical protein
LKKRIFTTANAKNSLELFAETATVLEQFNAVLQLSTPASRNAETRLLAKPKREFALPHLNAIAKPSPNISAQLQRIQALAMLLNSLLATKDVSQQLDATLSLAKMQVSIDVDLLSLPSVKSFLKMLNNMNNVL